VTEIALSTGCVRSHEPLSILGGRTVELASHPPQLLEAVLDVLAQSAARVVGVHAPCPNGGSVPDLAAEEGRWIETVQKIRRAMELARAIDARYVVIHAFYAVRDDLPSDDLRRAIALRSLVRDRGSIGDYVESEVYATAKERATRNLKMLLPELRRSFPHQRIVLENLNPRVGYGGILLDDVLEIACELDGAAGICLDLGHLTLAGAALGRDAPEQVGHARDLIWVTHIHQNFGGRFAIDRRWCDLRPRPGLQEIDAHLPLLTRYALAKRGTPVTAENSAFERKLLGTATYSRRGDDFPIKGAVPVGRLLSLVEASTTRVLECDPRYAPVDEIALEHDLAAAGKHPAGLT
jgi:sugar phosphate isomerase/epimerase